jgi:hypothetical protein
VNRVLTGLKLTASLLSPVYKSGSRPRVHAPVAVPLNGRKAIRTETEIALLLASVESSAISFLSRERLKPQARFASFYLCCTQTFHANHARLVFKLKRAG